MGFVERFFKRAFNGWIGEKKTALNMWLFLDEKTYKRFHDVILPSSNGTAQLDHILVSEYGVFIVETKNKTGWIFGSEDQATWTQILFKEKYTFQNPLRQTFRQKKVLADFLGISDRIIFPVVYFVGDCKFKTQMPNNVIRSGLGRYLANFREKILSQGEIDRITKKIELHLLESNLSSSDHIRSLKERHNSKNTCPKCGGQLLNRTVKQGIRAGRSFLGCEKYPKCRFTRSL